MPDPADLADLSIDAATKAALSFRHKVPEFTGYCLNCDEPLEDRRFCDADCRDEFDKRESRLK